MSQNRVLAIVAAVAAVGTLAYYFTSRSADTGPPRVAAGGTPPDQLLAAQCGSCHLAPSPGEMTRERWPFVVKWMGNYVGVQNIDAANDPLVLRDSVPETASMSPDDLSRLQAWLIAEAKPQAEMRIQRPRLPNTTRFTAWKPGWLPESDLITAVAIDEERQRLLVAAAAPARPHLHSLTPTGRQAWALPLVSEGVHLELLGDRYRVTVIGSFDKDRGLGQILDVIPGAPPSRQVLRDGGHRMTHTVTHDVDGDGRRDLVSASFGDGYGQRGRGRTSVAWAAGQAPSAATGATQTAPDAVEEKVLMREAGALNVVVADFDGDGKDDVLLARAQGRQQLIVWRNKGDRNFEKTIIKEWFPGFGLHRVEAADFDGDGDVDLVVVSGNNMEIPDPPLRPYHGVRVLENQGQLRFKERYHLPLYGALNAVVRDFDDDGDPDIAAIAFFLDYDAPEAFAYLENTGGFTFRASGLARADFGRWLSIGAGDLDGDGAPDIVLGNGRILMGVAAAATDRVRRDLRAAPSLLVLRNRP
jgi:hypothetical protein